jgi:hypothetical protein
MNANQLIVGKYLYGPFGNLLAMGGPLAPVMRFSSNPFINSAKIGMSVFHTNSSNICEIRCWLRCGLRRPDVSHLRDLHRDGVGI